jgi:hypothetical protein
MSKEGGNSQDEVNANSFHNEVVADNSERDANSHENSGKIKLFLFLHSLIVFIFSFNIPELKMNQETAPKENPFSFKHFLRQDTPNLNNINGNEPSTSGVSTSNSHSSSLNTSTGARPKIPQFQSSMHNNQSDSRMKRSPKFSSFDSQSSLSELAEERNMHNSRSNNCFNLDYQLPSTRSYSNYSLEPSSLYSTNERKTSQGRRSQPSSNNSNSVLPDFVQDHLLMESYYDRNGENMSPPSDSFGLENCENFNNHNGSRNLSLDQSFDLPFNRSPNTRRRGNHAAIPLDLPSASERRSASSDLPPCDLMEGAGADVAVQREETYGPHNEPEITREQAAIDKMQTLPDFLSDGPIYSRLADVANIVEDNNMSSIARLQQENERLRQDLEESRRVIIDLEQQIAQANVTLAESMEQVEKNLNASNQRCLDAQTQSIRAKDQVKGLMVSLN